MKKLILIGMVIVLTGSIAGCGASRKTGCPAVAKSKTIQSLKA